MKKSLPLFLGIVCLIILQSCEGFFGTKSRYEDFITKPTREPRTPAYIPVAPIIDGFNGTPFQNPIFVKAGMDNLYYVVDSLNNPQPNSTKSILYCFDESGRPSGFWAAPDSIMIRSVVQDRKMDLLATGKIRRTFRLNPAETVTHWLPAIFRISSRVNTSQGTFLNINTARITKSLVYPFFIRELNRLDFTDSSFVLGVNLNQIGMMPDNRYFITCSSKFTERFSLGSNFPNNSIIFCNTVDSNWTPVEVNGDAKYFASPYAIASTLQPPQNLDNFLGFKPNEWEQFLFTTSDNRFAIKAQFIEAIQLPDGKIYNLKAMADENPSLADGFLYAAGKITNPKAITLAGDGTGHFWIADGDTVRLFSGAGLEGVAPPPGSPNMTKAVKVSFGGQGQTPFNFKRISSITYNRRTLWVCDAGAKKIKLFRLTTDFD